MVHLFPEWKLKIVANYIFKDFWKNRKSIINKAINMLEEAEKKKENVDHSAEIEKLNIEKEKLQTKLNNLVDLRLEGDISKEVYEDKKKTIKCQIEYCENQISELSIEEAGINPIELQRDSLEKMLQFEFDIIKGQISDELIENFVDRIVVHEDYFEWRLKRLNTPVCGNIVGNFKKNCILFGSEKLYDSSMQLRRLLLVSNAP